MAFWDRFKRKRTKKRNFTASHTGRLFNDWNTMNSSPDGELENNLKLIKTFMGHGLLIMQQVLY